jgi:hypothetical protein
MQATAPDALYAFATDTEELGTVRQLEMGEHFTRFTLLHVPSLLLTPELAERWGPCSSRRADLP